MTTNSCKQRCIISISQDAACPKQQKQVGEKKNIIQSFRNAVSNAESAHLTDVLAEGGVGDHLAQEVQVRRHQCHDATADEHGHVLLVSQSHVLHRRVHSDVTLLQMFTDHLQTALALTLREHKGLRGSSETSMSTGSVIPVRARGVCVCVCVGLLTFCFDVISV